MYLRFAQRNFIEEPENSSTEIEGVHNKYILDLVGKTIKPISNEIRTYSLEPTYLGTDNFNDPIYGVDIKQSSKKSVPSMTVGIVIHHKRFGMLFSGNGDIYDHSWCLYSLSDYIQNGGVLHSLLVHVYHAVSRFLGRRLACI